MCALSQDVANPGITAELKQYAQSINVDLLGIASIERFADVVHNRHPQAIFPEVRSVLVVGKRITRGTLRGIEEGTQFSLYSQYGRDWLNNRFLAMCTFKVSEFLEDRGWEAVPLPNLPPETPPMGVPVREGQPAPNVMLDFEDAAVRAGVGAIGLCGLLLSPQYGPRQRIQLILTDAPLEADPLLESNICDGCAQQEPVCPMGAIDVNSVTNKIVCGKSMPIASINYDQCRKCANGAAPNPHYATGKPDRMAALCTRNCIAHLENNDLVENTFENAFRQRHPWQIIDERRIIS